MPKTLTEIDLHATWDRWCTTKDEIARAELVEHYLPFVRFLANQLHPQVSPYLQPELYSLGLVGLLDALDKFDPELGNRFETYGVARIRGAMRDGIRRMESLPRGARQRPGCMIQHIAPVDFQAARPAGASLQDSLEDPGHVSALDQLELEAEYQELLAAVEALPARERRVIRRYYYEGSYLKTIGAELGLTESRICQIHRGALKMLERTLLQLRAA